MGGALALALTVDRLAPEPGPAGLAEEIAGHCVAGDAVVRGGRKHPCLVGTDEGRWYVRTGHGAVRMTRSATLPIKTRLMPVRPWVPSTMRWMFCPLA